MSSQKQSVILHIYDVPSANQYITLMSPDLGAFHTGTEVYGKEYSFGGHSYDSTGIFITTPKDIKSLSVSNTFKYKESKIIGNTELSEESIKQMVSEMGAKDFRGKDYNLIQRNCNHFSDAFCKKLCGKGIPKNINNLVKTLAQYPWLEKQIPKEFVTPKALQNKVKDEEKKAKQKENKQNSSDSNSDTTNE
ncbi:unnamed protein product [Oppiella nova]|uniref:PPPDE domain-containing protein n=1 Tax=Oppiella nova TaxID=334625 RepID=A0A7R9QSX7_9ACAR|nr:unnamed protein product [Oppiella nova]CAG2173206.1 unnamed protein product [Oppiella nova]